MKAKSSHQKDRIKNITFYSVLICSCINHSAFAETDTEDGVLSNLVYFQPQIYIPEKAQPCQSIRVSDDPILTSTACYKKIFHMTRQALQRKISATCKDVKSCFQKSTYVFGARNLTQSSPTRSPEASKKSQDE